MKAFYRDRIPESSYGRKETVDKDILVTSRNGDRKIMQSMRITSNKISLKYIRDYSRLIWRLTYRFRVPVIWAPILNIVLRKK